MARLLWRNNRDKQVLLGLPVPHEFPGFQARADPEFPPTRGTGANGWTEVSDVYHAPEHATWAVVELHLQWARDAKVRWSGVSMEEVPRPKPRLVRLAAVNFCPTGKTPMGNCRSYAPLIAKAAAQHADLVVLGEAVTYYGLHRTLAQVAEPIPGPSTEYFGGLARRYNLYIVPGLIERDKGLIYNTAVLIGPDGKIVGKYRKTALTDGEIAAGITPGNSYPVFNTRFGKVGMMICYDGFFPEVAHQLSLHGAEVIAWPVWGCNPRLAAARAIDNQVYLVSSTYATPAQHWMISGVWDHAGHVIAQGKGWGTVAVATVNLNAPTYWAFLGDFKDYLSRNRPVAVGENSAAAEEPPASP
ncbi:MAG: carbon-nitrogen hydrolase family protein [Opitutaceae bacterium]